MRTYIFTTIIIALIALGCSSGGPVPSAPDVTLPEESSGRTHALWGLWQGVIDPQMETIEFIPLRMAELHLNALPFLEPPPMLNLTLESLEFNGNIIEADIGLRHPFLGLTEFTGFDVCGIFITNGSVSGFTDADLVMAGEGETRLLNPDGFSRWWNPAEFPTDGTIFGYTDGLLGAPDSFADYNATLNGYKYFCDDLDDPDDPLDDVTLANRGMFSAGQKNVRHYTIDIGAGLIFNYAIDANWQFPEGDPPWTAPDDFAPEANRSEAWRVTVTEVENTLYNDGVENGGNLKLHIDVYDWFNADLNTVRVESPGNFPMMESATAIGGGAGFSTYEIEILSATPAEEEIDILISVISEEEDFGGFITGVNTTSYFVQIVSVSTESQATVFTLELDMAKSFDTAYRDYSPAIETNWDDEVYLMWFRIYYVPGNTTTDYARSDDSGASWAEPYWTALGGFVDSDDASGAIDGVGDMYYYGCSHISISWTCIVRFNNWDFPNPSNQSGLFQVGSNYGRAFEFTHDGYPLCFGDRDNSINYKKGLTANSPLSIGGWPGGWSSTPQYNAVPNPSRLSKVDNMVRASGNSLHIAYFSSNSSDTWVRIAYNSDGAGLSWNYANDIYDGAADGYDSCHDPGLHVDADDVFRSAFIAHKSTPSESEAILYTRSTDGIAWDTPDVVYETAGGGLLMDVTIDKVTVSEVDILVLTFQEDDEIYITFSTDDGQTWEPPVIMSAGTGQAEKPDMCVTPDGYVHNTWQVGFNSGDEYAGSVEYIRAYFVEQ